MNKPTAIQPKEVFAIEKAQSQALWETNTAGAVARAQQEIQAAIVVARNFPRNEDEARAKLLKSCKRPEFAEDAQYSFKRGSKMEKGQWVDNYVTGPSVYLAREAARLWGNVRYGFEIVRDDADSRQIRCFAWDMESNTQPIQEAVFRKLIWRKNKKEESGGNWVEPDERDLRELTNRYAAIGYRNCILEILPSDLISEACRASDHTLKDNAAKDPDGERKRVVDAFAEINVMPSRLDQILGHPLAESSPEEITRLRGIYKSIRDGNSTLQDYLQAGDKAKAEDSQPDAAELALINEAIALMKHDAIDMNKAQRDAKISQWKGKLPELVAQLKADIKKLTSEKQDTKTVEAQPEQAKPANGNGQKAEPTAEKKQDKFTF